MASRIQKKKYIKIDMGLLLFYMLSVILCGYWGALAKTLTGYIVTLISIIMLILVSILIQMEFIRF